MCELTNAIFNEKKCKCAKCGAPVVERSDWGLSFYNCENCGNEEVYIKKDIFSKSATVISTSKMFNTNLIQYKIDGINGAYFIGCRDKYNTIDITIDKLLKLITALANGINLTFIINQEVLSNCQTVSEEEFNKFIDDNVSESSNAFMYFEDFDKNKYSLFISSTSLHPMISAHSYNIFLELSKLKAKSIDIDENS